MSVNGELVCSARGCRERAGWALQWNNPRLHPPERRKTWLACDDHRQSLGEYLGVRGFLRETVPAQALAVQPPGSQPPGSQPPGGRSPGGQA